MHKMHSRLAGYLLPEPHSDEPNQQTRPTKAEEGNVVSEEEEEEEGSGRGAAASRWWIV